MSLSMESVSYLGGRRGAGRELRLVLIGDTGLGKSASGNTILGRRQYFRSVLRASSVTRVCQQGSADLHHWRVVVVDTPGFRDTRMAPVEIHNKVAKCVPLSAPGPHAFLLVISLSCRYTADQAQAIDQMAQIFGEGAVRNYTLVLFTHGDDLEESEIEVDEYLGRASQAGLRALVYRCGGRYHVLNNRDRGNTAQVTELLRKVERMVAWNDGGFYTNAMLEAALSVKRRKTLMAGMATGLAVGAVLGAATPLAAAAGASFMGSMLASNAAGSIVAVASGKTAVGLGMVTGSMIGVVKGVQAADEAAGPREASLNTLKQVGQMGVTAVKVGTLVGAGAALVAVSATALTTGAVGVANAGAVGVANAGAVGVANAGAVGVANAGAVGVANAGAVGVANAGAVNVFNAGAVGVFNAGAVNVANAGAVNVADVGKAVAGIALAGGMVVKVVKKRAGPRPELERGTF